MEVEITRLIAQAWDARERAYAPYSKFAVGAAVVARSGEIYIGCNVENISFGLTNCAERVAMQTGIAKGERGFTTVIVVADTKDPISPCGACRQVMAEFGVETVVLANRKCHETYAFEELFPRGVKGILDHK